MIDEKIILENEIKKFQKEYDSLSIELDELELKLIPLNPGEEPPKIFFNPEVIERKKYIKSRLPIIETEIKVRKERIRLIDLGI